MSVSLTEKLYDIRKVNVFVVIAIGDAANLIVDDIPAANLIVNNIPAANLIVDDIPAANLIVDNIPTTNLIVDNIPATNFFFSFFSNLLLSLVLLSMSGGWMPH